MDEQRIVGILRRTDRMFWSRQKRLTIGDVQLWDDVHDALLALGESSTFFARYRRELAADRERGSNPTR